MIPPSSNKKNVEKTTKKTEEKMVDFGRGLKVGAVLGVGGATILTEILSAIFTSSTIPNARVKDGYVPPRTLEVLAEDVDYDKIKETILMVDKKPYLFKYDENKNPILVPYKVNSEATYKE